MTTIRIMDDQKQIGTANFISYATERKMAPIYTLGEEWYKEKYLRAQPRYYGSAAIEADVSEGEYYTVIIEEEADGERKQTILEKVEFYYEEEGVHYFISNGLEFRSKITWYSRARTEIGHEGIVIKIDK